MGEEPSFIKELKMKEIHAMMKINWHVELDTCEYLEAVLKELVTDVFSKCPGTTEEKQFVNVTVKAIEDCLKRESSLAKFVL